MTRPFDTSKLDAGVRAIPLDETSGLSPQDQKTLDEATKCATAVGNLCFAWSALEGKIDQFIKIVLSCPAEGAAEAILAVLDWRAKVQIALALGNLSRISDEWYEVLKWCIDRTDHDLRTRRNAFVHDPVWVGPEGVKRVRRKTNRGTGAFKEDREEMNQEQVWKLVEEVQAMVIRLDCLLAPTIRRDWKAELLKHNLLPEIGA